MRFTNEVDYHRALQLLTEAGCPWEPAAQPSARPQSPLSHPSRSQSRPLSRPFSAASTVVNIDERGVRDITVNEAPRSLSLRPTESAHTTRPPGKSEPSAALPPLRTLLPPQALQRSASSTPTFKYQDRVGSDDTSHEIVPQSKEHPTERYTNLDRPHWGNWHDPGANSQRGAASNTQEIPSTSPIKRTDIGDIMYTPRPSTAPIMESQGTINRMLPPPRELPFKKLPSLTYSERQKPTLQFGTTLESASFVTSAGKEAGNQLNAQTSKQALSTPIDSVSKRAKTAPAPKKAPKRPRTATGVTKRKTALQAKTPVPTVDEILRRGKGNEALYDTENPTFTTSSKDEETSLRQLIPPAPAESELHSNSTVRNEPIVVLVEDSQSPPRPKAKDLASAMKSTLVLREISNLPPGPSTRSPPPAAPRPVMELIAADLSNYARDGSTTRAERMKEFETFVCEQLQDDGFHRLVQDMEIWWPRLLMGKNYRDLGDV